MNDSAARPGSNWRNVAFLPRISCQEGSVRRWKKESCVELTIAHDVEAISLTYMCATGRRPIRKVGNDLRLDVKVDGRAVTWGGEAEGRCRDGSTLTSDRLPISLKAGQTITVETTARGWKIPVDAAGTVRPLRVNAEGEWPSLLIIGSSSGVPSAFTAGLGDAQLATTNASISGSRNDTFTEEALADFLGVRHDHGWTHAMLQVGPNNLPGNMADICQGQLDLARRVRKFGITHITQTVWQPVTASTDGWKTVASQRPVHANRGPAVAWLRDGAPMGTDGWYTLTPGPDAIRAGDEGHPFTEILDYSAWVQAPENPDVWRADLGGPMATDGLHSTALGYEPAREPMERWAEGLHLPAAPRRAL